MAILTRLSSRTLLNLAMAAAVIVLAVIAFYPRGEAPPPPMVQLLPLSKADVDSLAIHSHDKPVVRFTRQDRQWFMTDPIRIRASEHRINTLLDLLQQPAGTQLPVDKQNLAKYGLDSPRYGLEFNGHSMVIGDTDPIHQRRYVMARDKVYIIEDFFSHFLLEGEGALVDHALLPPGSVIEKLQLPGLTVTKSEDQWRIVEAGEADSKSYSQDSLNTLVDEWRYGRALSVSLLSGPYQRAGAPAIKIYLRNLSEPVEYYLEQNPLHTLLIRPDLKVRYHLTHDTALRLTRLTEKTTGGE